MLKKNLLILLLCYMVHISWAQKIMNWYEGKSSAIALTFDDWSPGHGAIAVPQMLERNLVGTFYVTIENTWAGYSQIINAYNNGCEIGNHTQTHPRLTDFQNDIDVLTDEIVETKKILEKNVPNLTVNSFCYPQGLGPGNKTIEKLVKQDHIAARSIYSTFGNWSYKINNYYELPTVTVNKQISLNTFKGYLNTVQKDGGLMTFMYHSIYNNKVKDHWWDDISEETFVAHLEEIKKVENKIWVTTVDKAVKYHKEKNCATLTEISKGDGFIIFSLTDTLSDNTIFNQPLTIQLILGKEEEYTIIEQNGVEIDYRKNGDTLYFNAVPDAGNITLKKDKTASLYGKALDNKISLNIYPTIIKNKALIQITLEKSSNIEIYLYTLNGQQVKPLVKTYQNSMLSEYNIFLKDLSSGVYIMHLYTNNGEFITKKIIKK